MLNHVRLEFNPLPVEFLTPCTREQEVAILVELAKGRRCLEIGTRDGSVSANLMKVARSVVGLDITSPSKEMHEGQSAEETLPISLVGNRAPGMEVILIEPDSLSALFKALEGRVFDFVFIDGNHRFDFVKNDYEVAGARLSKGGIRVLHDVWWDCRPPFISGPEKLLEQIGGCIINGTHLGMSNEDWLKLEYINRKE